MALNCVSYILFPQLGRFVSDFMLWIVSWSCFSFSAIFGFFWVSWSFFCFWADYLSLPLGGHRMCPSIDICWDSNYYNVCICFLYHHCHRFCIYCRLWYSCTLPFCKLLALWMLLALRECLPLRNAKISPSLCTTYKRCCDFAVCNTPFALNWCYHLNNCAIFCCPTVLVAPNLCTCLAPTTYRVAYFGVPKCGACISQPPWPGWVVSVRWRVSVDNTHFVQKNHCQKEMNLLLINCFLIADFVKLIHFLFVCSARGNFQFLFICIA